MDLRSRTVIGAAPRSVDEATAALDSLVMTWAHDTVAGQPVYIGELDESRNGNACFCECASCGHPLRATNAGKAEGTYVQRPHFKHQAGVVRNDCLVLTARAAALRLLIDEGVLDMPARTYASKWQGLSGKEYEGSATTPARRLALVGARFRDRTSAILELADGRRVLVTLTGTNVVDEPAADGDEPLRATIFIDINDPSLAGADTEQIRSRLKLLPGALCWQAHWDDDALAAEAAHEAKALAAGMLDWPGAEAEFDLEAIPAELRRETLLHLTVKQILASAACIHVPCLVVEATAGEGSFRATATSELLAQQVLTLRNVRLEQRFRHVIPDVCAECVSADGIELGLLFIEVTVTHGFDTERLDRVREADRLTLEIDLREVFGRVSIGELTEQVIDGLTVKRWLHHPALLATRDKLQGMVQQASDERAAAARASFKSPKPLGDLGQDGHLDLNARRPTPNGAAGKDLLRCHEYVQKGRFAGWLPDTDLLDGLVSLRHRVGLGAHDGLSASQVAHKLRCTTDTRLHAVILIAVRHYGVPGSGTDDEVLSHWASEGRARIKERDPMWIPHMGALQLLSELFPELERSAAKLVHVLHPSSGSVQWTTGPAPVDRGPRIEAMRKFYRDGAYRLYAPRIDYDRVLAEARDARRNDESLHLKLAAWANDFSLHGDLKPILAVLREAGLVV